MAAASKTYSGFNILAKGEWLGKDLLFILLQQLQLTAASDLFPHIPLRAWQQQSFSGSGDLRGSWKQDCQCEEKGLQSIMKLLWHLFLCLAQNRVAWQHSGGVSFPWWETWDNESVVQLIKSQWHLLGALLASSEGWKSLDRARVLP